MDFTSWLLDYDTVSKLEMYVSIALWCRALRLISYYFAAEASWDSQVD